MSANPEVRPSAASAWAGRLAWREVLLLAPTLAWVAIDRTPWSWDPAWYGEVSCDLWWTLTHQPAAWGSQMLAAFGIKAPAIAWLAQFLVPVGHGLGNIDDALMFLPLLAAALSVRLWFELGRTLWAGDARGGWLCALLGAGAPLFVGISHQFFVEPLQLLGVSWLWWLALCGQRLPRLRQALGTAGAGIFLVAVKVTSPAFAAVPFGLAAWSVARHRRPWLAPTRAGRGGDLGVALLIAAGAVLTAAWYAKNLGALREFVTFAAQDSSSLIYGQRPAFLAKWGFWLPAVHREFFNPLVGWIVVPLAFACAIPALSKWRELPPVQRVGGLAAIAGGLQVLLVLWGFSLQIPEITRYSLPLLVSALLPLVWLISLGPRAWLAPVALVLVFGQWVWSHGTALGALPAAPQGSEWLVRADAEPSFQSELDALIDRTTSPATAFRYHVNGYELAWLNANTLSFHAAKRRLSTGVRAYYTSLGYGANDPDAAYRRVIEMQADSFISLEAPWHDAKPSFMNQTALRVLEMIKANPSFLPEDFYNKHHIVLYRRTTKPH